MDVSYIVKPDKDMSIDLAPKTLVEEVIQNVRTILSTVQYEIPLDRGFGLPGSIVDMPMQQAQAVLSSAIFTQIRKYEPRATVKSLTFQQDLTGKLIPKVEVSINETG